MLMIWYAGKVYIVILSIILPFLDNMNGGVHLFTFLVMLFCLTVPHGGHEGNQIQGDLGLKFIIL